MANLDSATSDSFSFSKNLEEIYNSKFLRAFVRGRLNVLRLKHIITEDDVINNVSLELFKAQQSGREIVHPIAWAKIVSERHIMHTKKKNQLIDSLDEMNLLNTIPSSYPEEEENCLINEEREEINQKIQLLKPASKKILELRFFQNLSWEQIAKLLSKEEGQEINAPTARKRGERALKELRHLYIDGTNNLLTEQEISTSLTVKNHQQSTEESDLVKEIRQKIHQLNPAEQKLLTWHFIDNLPWSQVAELLSKEEGNIISTAAVRKRGERAMRKLKETHIEGT